MKTEIDVKKLHFDQDDLPLMSADSKIGLLSTIDDDGCPHISFISSLQPLGKDELTIGQFCAGLSKEFMLKRQKTGFLFLTPNMEIWRGRALYDRSAKSGPEYELYNQKPLFRYNSYFGIGTVHYFKLKDITSKEQLTKGSIASGAIKSRLAAPFFTASKGKVLNDFSCSLFGQIDGLKFISYLDENGFPVLVPVIQAGNAGKDRVAFAMQPYRSELLKIPAEAAVAIIALNLKMESVLIKGSYRHAGFTFSQVGLVDIKKVYNSMPPQPGYIYPRPSGHKKVVDF